MFGVNASIIDKNLNLPLKCHFSVLPHFFPFRLFCNIAPITLTQILTTQSSNHILYYIQIALKNIKCSMGYSLPVPCDIFSPILGLEILGGLQSNRFINIGNTDLCIVGQQSFGYFFSNASRWASDNANLPPGVISVNTHFNYWGFEVFSIIEGCFTYNLIQIYKNNLLLCYTSGYIYVILLPIMAFYITNYMLGAWLASLQLQHQSQVQGNNIALSLNLAETVWSLHKW